MYDPLYSNTWKGLTYIGRDLLKALEGKRLW